MATRQAEQVVSLPAGTDLSAAAGLWVALNSSGAAVLAGDGAAAIGVVANPAASGTPVGVALAGVSKVVCGASVAAGTALASDAAGKAVTATTGEQIQGWALETGTAGQVISVLLDRPGAKG